MSISNDLYLNRKEIDRYIAYIGDPEVGVEIRIELVKIFELEWMANNQLKGILVGKNPSLHTSYAKALARQLNDKLFQLMLQQFIITRELNVEIISRHDNVSSVYQTATELLHKDSAILDRLNHLFKRTRSTRMA